NADPASPFFDVLDLDRVAAAGHSQGGGGAINAGNDPRVDCTAPIQSIAGNLAGLHGPMFLTAGTLDFIVPPGSVSNLFDGSPVTTIYANRQLANHFSPLGNGEFYRGYLTAWLAWCLLDDD